MPFHQNYVVTVYEICYGIVLALDGVSTCAPTKTNMNCKVRKDLQFETPGETNQFLKKIFVSDPIRQREKFKNRRRGSIFWHDQVLEQKCTPIR